MKQVTDSIIKFICVIFLILCWSCQTRNKGEAPQKVKDKLNYSFAGDYGNLEEVLHSKDSDFLEPDLSGDGKLLAYASNNFSDNFNIYIKNLENGETFEVTKDKFDNRNPKILSNPPLLTYSANVDGKYRIYLINYNNLKKKQIISGPGDVLLTSWHRDGDKLAYAMLNPRTGNWEILVYHLKLDKSFPLLIEGFYPAWSPNGQKIAFQRPKDKAKRYFTLWLYDTITKKLYELPNWGCLATVQPTWSPDSTALAFICIKNLNTKPGKNTNAWEKDNLVYSLQIYQLDKNKHTILFETQKEISTPVWNNKYIFFSLKLGEHFGIYRIKVSYDENHSK